MVGCPCFCVSIQVLWPLQRPRNCILAYPGDVRLLPLGKHMPTAGRMFWNVGSHRASEVADLLGRCHMQVSYARSGAPRAVKAAPPPPSSLCTLGWRRASHLSSSRTLVCLRASGAADYAIEQVVVVTGILGSRLNALGGLLASR